MPSYFHSISMNGETQFISNNAHESFMVRDICTEDAYILQSDLFDESWMLGGVIIISKKGRYTIRIIKKFTKVDIGDFELVVPEIKRFCITLSNSNSSVILHDMIQCDDAEEFLCRSEYISWIQSVEAMSKRRKHFNSIEEALRHIELTNLQEGII